MTAAEGSRTPPCGSETQIPGKSECGTWFQGSPGNSGAFGSWWAWLDLWFRARCLTCWDDPCPGIHVTQTLRGPCRVGLRTQRPSFSCSLSTSFLFCECWRPAPVLLGFRRAQDPVLGQGTAPQQEAFPSYRIFTCAPSHVSDLQCDQIQGEGQAHPSWSGTSQTDQEHRA